MRTLRTECARACRAALVVELIVLAGCSSAGSGGWTKPGMTEEQLRSDTLQCLSQAQEIVPGRDGPRTQIDQDRYRRCMEGLGYTTASGK
jgi:hypothetical protein